MDPQVYAGEAETEAKHWWFIGRRKLFRSLIDGPGADRSWKVLDVGTSTGGNLRLLSDMGFVDVTGVDSSPDAVRFCESKGFGPVHLGDVQQLPFDDCHFNLVLATDIVEHVDDDVRAMSELARVLVPGGRLLATVPAFMSLWGRQDEFIHHKRRYKATEVRSLAQTADLHISKCFYFNFLLFFPIWTVRKIMNAVGLGNRLEIKINSPIINAVLTRVFLIDVLMSPWLCPPFGVSYLILCEKR